MAAPLAAPDSVAQRMIVHLMEVIDKLPKYWEIPHPQGGVFQESRMGLLSSIAGSLQALQKAHARVKCWIGELRSKGIPYIGSEAAWERLSIDQLAKLCDEEPFRKLLNPAPLKAFPERMKDFRMLCWTLEALRDNAASEVQGRTPGGPSMADDEKASLADLKREHMAALEKAQVAQQIFITARTDKINFPAAEKALKVAQLKREAEEADAVCKKLARAVDALGNQQESAQGVDVPASGSPFVQTYDPEEKGNSDASDGDDDAKVRADGDDAKSRADDGADVPPPDDADDDDTEDEDALDGDLSDEDREEGNLPVVSLKELKMVAPRSPRVGPVGPVSYALDPTVFPTGLLAHAANGAAVADDAAADAAPDDQKEDRPLPKRLIVAKEFSQDLNDRDDRRVAVHGITPRVRARGDSGFSRFTIKVHDLYRKLMLLDYANFELDYPRAHPEDALASPFPAGSMHDMQTELPTKWHAYCGLCYGVSPHLEWVLKLKAIDNTVMPFRAQGFVLRTKCACKISQVHLRCILASKYYPSPDRDTGYYRFGCVRCGYSFDMDYDRKSASLTQLAFAIRAQMILHETYHLQGDTAGACRIVIELPNQFARVDLPELVHWLHRSSHWTEEQRVASIDAMVVALTENTWMRNSVRILKMAGALDGMDAFFHRFTQVLTRNVQADNELTTAVKKVIQRLREGAGGSRMLPSPTYLLRQLLEDPDGIRRVTVR